MVATKSAIQEVRDQLLLDRADGQYLTIVSENIGVDRPIFGFANDDLWRAVVRELAFDYKQIVTIFRELLTLVFGPQGIQATVLAVDAETGDEQITITDPLSIPQRGTLILDEGLAAQETVDYLFRDPRNGVIDLASALTQDHTALVDNRSSFLAQDATAGNTTITVENASLFPDPVTVGNYPVLIDSGKEGTRSGTGDSFAVAGTVVTLTDAAGLFTTDLVDKLIIISGATTAANDGTFRITAVPSATTLTYINAGGAVEAFPGTWVIPNLNVEEVVLCTGIAGNVLTVSALVNDHKGPQTTPIVAGVQSQSPDDTILFVDDIADFPADGLLRVQEAGGTTEEDVRYNDVDVTGEFFELNSILGNTYTTDASVTLLRDGALVQIAQVQVPSVGWEIFETEPNKLRIYLPPEVDENRLLDATFLHDSVSNPPGISSTVATGAEIGDTVLELASGSGFPSAGVIVIDAGGTPEYISYYRRDQLTAVLYTGKGIGGTGDSFAFAAGVVTLTDAAGLFTAGMVGMSIVIEGATTAGNNGTFTIASFIGATQITYNNTNGATEAFPGTWSVPDAPTGNTVPIGTEELLVNDATPFVAALALGIETAVIDPGGAPETVTIDEVDEALNKLILKVPTTVAHNTVNNVFDTVQAGNQLTGNLHLGPDALHLTRPLTAVHAAAQTVALFRVQYGSTELENGQIFTSNLHRYQGSYLWDVFSRLARFCGNWTGAACGASLETTLAEDLTGPTFLVCSSRGGDTALEVKDASLFRPGPDFQQVRVGRNLAGTETRQINDITLRRTITTLTCTGTAGNSSFTVSASGVLPEAKGYRLFLDNDGTGTGEEIVEVASVSGTTVSIIGTLAYNHTVDSVRLLADVLTVDTLAYEHEGQISLTQKLFYVPGVGSFYTSNPVATIQNDRVASIEEVRSFIDVVDASVLDSTGGRALLNFGREEAPYESQLKLDGTGDSFAFASPTVTLTDAAGLFTADMVGRQITIVGATTSGNDGTFTIASYIGPTQITWSNLSGAAEAFTGNWFVEGPGVGATTLSVADGSGFPTSNFWIIVGQDTRVFEALLVSSRTGNILTLNASYSTYFTHQVGEWVKYLPGELEEVFYQGTETGGANERITFDEGYEIKLTDRHMTGEPVALSTSQAVPSEYGEDYPFYIPSSWADRLKFLFDLARAAGVQVVIINDR